MLLATCIFWPDYQKQINKKNQPHIQMDNLDVLLWYCLQPENLITGSNNSLVAKQPT